MSLSFKRTAARTVPNHHELFGRSTEVVRDMYVRASEVGSQMFFKDMTMDELTQLYTDTRRIMQSTPASDPAFNYLYALLGKLRRTSLGATKSEDSSDVVLRITSYGQPQAREIADVYEVPYVAHMDYFGTEAITLDIRQLWKNPEKFNEFFEMLFTESIKRTHMEFMDYEVSDFKL